MASRLSLCVNVEEAAVKRGAAEPRADRAPPEADRALTGVKASERRSGADSGLDEHVGWFADGWFSTAGSKNR